MTTNFLDRTDPRTRVKLCEFETLDAAYEAAEMGADALGFHLFRHQDAAERVERFAEIFRWLPTGVQKVLLSDLELPDLADVLARLPADCVQLYPDWSANRVAHLRSARSGLTILKVVSAQPAENVTPDYRAFFARYEPVVDGFLLDSFRAGGTGLTADWQYCAALVRMTERPVFLAGGLSAANVAEAIRTVRPFGVDVENGVSTRIPGGPLVKNIEKSRAFIAAVMRSERVLERRSGSNGVPGLNRSRMLGL